MYGGGSYGMDMMGGRNENEYGQNLSYGSGGGGQRGGGDDDYLKQPGSGAQQAGLNDRKTGGESNVPVMSRADVSYTGALLRLVRAVVHCSDLQKIMFEKTGFEKHGVKLGVLFCLLGCSFTSSLKAQVLRVGAPFLSLLPFLPPFSFAFLCLPLLYSSTSFFVSFRSFSALFFISCAFSCCPLFFSRPCSLFSSSRSLFLACSL